MRYINLHFTYLLTYLKETKRQVYVYKLLRVNQCYQSYKALEIYIPGQLNRLNKTFKL